MVLLRVMARLSGSRLGETNDRDVVCDLYLRIVYYKIVVVVVRYDISHYFRLSICALVLLRLSLTL